MSNADWAVTPVDAPWEGAQAWKITQPEDFRYEITIRGPWDDEPDKIQWVDPTSDLDCLMVRNQMGNWCGYVGVPAGHPAYGVSYDSLDVEVHGGLTFGDTCSTAEEWVVAEGCTLVHPASWERVNAEGKHEHLVEVESTEPSAGICHVPLPGRPHDVFWQGFDCGHAFDFSPGMHSMEQRVMPDLLAKFGKTVYDHEAAMAQKDEWHVEKYRVMSYVRDEVSGLAAQLAVLAPSS